MPLRDWYLKRRYIKQLSHKNDDVREAAKKELGTLEATHDEMVRGYIKALSSRTRDAHTGAAIRLGQLGDKRAVAPLLEALRRGDCSMRDIAADALGKLGDKQAVEPLLEMLADEMVWAREAAPAASWKETDSHVRARHSVVQALASLGDNRAVEPLIEMLKSGDCDARTVTKALRDLGDKRAVGPLLEMLGDEYAGHDVIVALGNLGDKLAVEPLLKMLGNEKAEAMAVWALGAIGDERAVEPLIEMLRSRRWNVRENAAQALGKLGDERAIEPLFEGLGDEEVNVRQAAAVALRRLGDDRTVQELMVLQDKQPELFMPKDKDRERIGQEVSSFEAYDQGKQGAHTKISVYDLRSDTENKIIADAQAGKSCGPQIDPLIVELQGIFKMWRTGEIPAICSYDEGLSSNSNDYEPRARDRASGPWVYKRVRAIGEELHKLGKLNAMQAAYYRCGESDDISRAWHGIGEKGSVWMI